MKKAKGREKQYQVSDGDGLYAIVRPNGTVWWRFDYYRPSGGRNTLSFSTYPEVGLGQARDKRTEARELVARDLDPMVEGKRRRAEKAQTDADTFGVLVHDYIAHLRALGRAEATIPRRQDRLGSSYLEQFRDDGAFSAMTDGRTGFGSGASNVTEQSSGRQGFPVEAGPWRV